MLKVHEKILESHKQYYTYTLIIVPAQLVFNHNHWKQKIIVYVTVIKKLRT